MAIIASTLQRIKSDPLPFLGGAEFVNQCFAKVGYVWRNRVLDPARTMGLFMIQVLNGNTAITHLRQLGNIIVANGEFKLEPQQGPQDFCRRSIVEALSGTIIQLLRDSCNLLAAHFF